jgi:hypothetical protein
LNRRKDFGNIGICLCNLTSTMPERDEGSEKELRTFGTSALIGSGLWPNPRYPLKRMLVGFTDAFNTPSDNKISTSVWNQKYHPAHIKFLY